MCFRTYFIVFLSIKMLLTATLAAAANPWSLGVAGATAALPADRNVSADNPAALHGMERLGLEGGAATQGAAGYGKLSGPQWGGWAVEGRGSGAGLAWARGLGSAGALGIAPDYDWESKNFGGAAGLQQGFTLPGEGWGELRLGVVARSEGGGAFPVQAGLAWGTEEQGFLALQAGQESGSVRARAGLQAPLALGFGLMAGAGQGKGGNLAAHAGLSWKGGFWEAAYAVAGEAGGWAPGQAVEALQSFALRLSWGPERPKAPKAELLQMLREGKDGAVAHAELRLVDATREGRWSLALLDEGGNLMALFRGNRLPPKRFSWNGEDARGRRSSAKRWRYESRLTPASGGPELKRSGWLEHAKGTADEIARAKAESEDSYGWRRAPSAALQRKGMKPVILLSSFQGVEGMEGEESGQWKLEVSGDKGFKRTFKGKGPIPESLAWDGLDDQGVPTEGEGMRYTLRMTTASGRKLERRSVLAPLAPGSPATSMGLVDVEEEAGLGLRQSSRPAGEESRARRAKIGLSRDKGLKVAAADFDFSDQGDEQGSWELRLSSASGKTVRTLKGVGKPPQGLKWDGLDDNGKPALLDTGASFEMRVAGADGKAKEWKEPLVVKRDLDSLHAQDALKLRLEGQSACRPDAEPGCLRCTLHFPFGGTTPSRQGRAELRAIKSILAGLKAAELRVEGHSDSQGEAAENLRISQARAEYLLEYALGEAGLEPNMAVALGLGSARPVDAADNEEAKAKNRRAELLLKF
jgi:outer membrane protein OmpA-like peptidoglycan-associated protein